MKEWCNIIDQLQEFFSVKFFRLLGGEPFVSPYFRDIVHYIKSCSAKLTIVTNGTLIDEEMAHFLVSKKVDRIRISLDGLQKIDQFYRGEGSFLKTINGIKAIIHEKELKKSQIPKIEIHPFVSKINYSEIPRIILLSKKLKTEFNYHYLTGDIVSRVQDPGFPDNSQKSSLLSVQERKKFEKTLHKHITLTKLIKRLLFSKISQFPIFHDCSRSAFHFLVDPWGDVFACEFLYDYILGNCREESVKEIWLSQKRFLLRRGIKKGILQTCCNCGRRNLCPPTDILRIRSLFRLLQTQLEGMK